MIIAVVIILVVLNLTLLVRTEALDHRVKALKSRIQVLENDSREYRSRLDKLHDFIMKYDK